MGLKFKFFILLFLFLLLSFFAYPSEIEEVYYKADEMNVNFTNEGEIEGISLNGNVEIIYKDMHLFCKKARFNKITGEINCEGEVKIKSTMGDFKSENVKYCIKDNCGILNNASFSSPPFYGKGERIESYGNTIILYRGYVTTCNKKNPHYRVSARRIIYVKNDYIKVEKMRIVAGKKFSIFYFPKFKYHIKEKQPSVLTKTLYKTRIGRTLDIEFFQKNEKKDIATKEMILLGTKGSGLGFEVNSEKNNFDIQTLGFKEYDVDKVQPGVIVEFNKNYKTVNGSGNTILDWRWMYDNDFFNDFFSEQYYKKSKTYNYFSITYNYKWNFFNLNVRENAREPILNIEKLPEVQIFSPFRQISTLPIFFSNNLSLTNFNYNDDEYFRAFEKFVVESRKNLGYFTLSPFASFAGIDYRYSSDDNFHYISEAGVKLSTTLMKKRREKESFFTPSVALFNRFTKCKISQLPQLSPFEEMKNGKFFEVSFNWDFFEKSEYTGNISISNLYDFNRDEFNNTYFDYSLKINKNLSILGDNKFNFNEGIYEFGINDLVFNKDDFKFSFGTRYEDESDIFGIENWIEKRINKNWKYRIGFYYDFETDNIALQSYEIWRKLHCLTLDFKISKDRDNVSFYIIILPSILFEKENWKERYYQWR